MARNKSNQTRPDPNSNQVWKQNVDQQNPMVYQMAKHQRYFNHYYSWLQQIAYQLYSWGGDLPQEIPKNLIEIYLHQYGRPAMARTDKYGSILVNGTGEFMGNYFEPTTFRVTDKYYADVSFPLYYYGRAKFPNSGILMKNRLQPVNTKVDLSSVSGFTMYAENLAFIKQISDINLNTQKTPIIVTYDDNLQLQEVNQLFDRYDGSQPVIFTRNVIDEEGKKLTGGQMATAMQVLDLKTKFVVDKLETQKQKVWDEAMGWLGLMNMSQYKKERMTKTESEANTEQVFAMQNSMLQARLEFTELYYQLYGKRITVEPTTQSFTTDDPEGGGEYALAIQK